VTAAGTRVPLVDLGPAHREVAREIDAGFAEVMASGAYIGGRAVGDFERAYAAFCGVRACVGVGNGTDALELALRAIGVGPGDEVVVPAATFIATAEAVARAGARPVVVDVDPGTQLLDPAAAAGAFGPRTRAVVPVHLYGQVAPVERLAADAAAAGVAIVEDAAQAHGASRLGRPAGTFGVAAGTSFYPGKNLGAYGDAGAVLTDSDEVAAAVRVLGDHGSDGKYRHPVAGVNSRLDTLQAVVLRAKLGRLAAWNEARRAAAARYDTLLAGLDDVVRPVTLAGNIHVWHLYVVRVPRRDLVLSRLAEAGIGAGVHYPVPVHLHGAFASLGYRVGAFPAAEEAAREILSLPMHPHLTVDAQERVVDELRRALS
jgi:dTDP-4-amino-4,6-dideoxygalactose transaminase